MTEPLPGNDPVTVDRLHGEMPFPDPGPEGLEPSRLALIALRVWWEVGEPSLRGRLLIPSLEEPTVGIGEAQLLALVERALRAVSGRPARGDGPVTPG